MGKYYLKNNTGTKTLEIKVEGLFSEKDGMDYINSYQSTIKGINTKDYELDFDCTNLSVTPAESVTMLQGCFEMYKQANFKVVKASVPKTNGVILKMQFNRLAKAVGLDNFQIVD